MRYIHVSWFHDYPDDPVELYSELDDEAWETRKVEVFRDGRIGFAGASVSSGSSSLGEVPVPPLEEIALDPQFRPEEVTKAEFERMWDLARASADSPHKWDYSQANPREV